MAASLDPRIIVLALGAGALGFPDALRVLLLDVAGQRSPLTDIAICVFAIAVVTAQALGALMLARFIRKAARAPGASPPTAPPRTDPFAQVTLVVSLGVAFLVSACLFLASGAGAGALGLLYLVADIATKMKSSVIAVLATGAAVLLCARPLLRVFRQEEDHPDGAAAASGSAATGRFASMPQVASLTGAAAAFVLAVSGGLLYTQRGSLIGVATAVGAVLLVAGFAFARGSRNAAGAGGRSAPAPAADTRRVGGKLAWLVPYLAVVSFAAVICCLVLTTMYAPLESGPGGAKYP